MIAEIANELNAAWTGSTVIDPPSSRYPDFDLDIAYAVEARLQRERAGSGRAVVGRKVGYANKAVWRVMKLETLVWASMYDDTVHDAASLPGLSLQGFFPAPRIEPEIVFKLSRDMPANIDAAGALACVEWMALGFEIIDCPFPAWQFKPADFVAAFGLHRALLIGERTPVAAASIPALADRLAAFKVRLSRNGEFVEEGAGKNSLRSPALCLAELAGAATRRAAPFPLKAGELISTGTLVGPQTVSRGESWSAEPEGLPVAGLTISTDN